MSLGPDQAAAGTLQVARDFYAAEIGCADWAQFCLKFIISHPAVSCVIAASSTALHMRSNLQAGCGPLPDAELRRRMMADVNVR